MIAQLDPITTPNGSGLTDFELETEHRQALMSRLETCPRSPEENAGTVACERCKGFGKVPNKESYSCGGLGEDQCPTCKGTGTVSNGNVIREVPKFKSRPPVFQRGDRCWVVGIKGCFEGRVTGLRCDTLWVQNDAGNAEMLECDWEYSVTSVKQLTQEEWPESSGWYKARVLCGVQPQE
jgi:hypothetical protein